MRDVRPWVRVLGVVALIIALVAVGIGGYVVHTVRASFPQVSGDLRLSGLASEVEVLRNDRGIPTIYASTLDDLFFAQGFVHAQDRFWEMDVRRHITSGRLSEMFGESQVPTDTFLRTLGWRRIAEQEIDLLSERSLRILQAYADGVNAYLDDRRGAELSLEYAVLALQNSDYQPEPWEAADSVAWLKALAWDLRGNMDDEIYRAVMSASMGSRRPRTLPQYPYADHRPIVEVGAVVDGVFDQDASTNSGNSPRAASRASTWSARRGVRVRSTRWCRPWKSCRPVGTRHRVELVGRCRHQTDTDSRCWPMILTWRRRCPACGTSRRFDAQTSTTNATTTSPGGRWPDSPGVHRPQRRRRMGVHQPWTGRRDLVLHQLDGDTYLYDGELRPLDIRTEVIEVAGSDPVTIRIRSTPDGPIISGIDEIEEYDRVGRDSPVPAPNAIDVASGDPQSNDLRSDGQQTDDARGDSGYAVALRWTALQPQPTFDAFDALNTAQSWEDFREAARYLAVPAQNLLYADTSGRIGYQAPGRIPIRRGYDGKWPVPGWSSELGWDGYIPFESLPSVIDPPEGWIVTANQAVIGEEFPYFLTDDWSYGARSQRIVDLIESSTAGGALMTAERMRDIQMDSNNALAEFLVPRLLETPAPSGTEDARAVLAEWDYQQTADSAAAAYFNAIWSQMVTRMFDAAADGEIVESSGNDRFWLVIERLWDDPTNVWWIDKTTPAAEDRDGLLAIAQQAAADELRERLGGDPSAWRWGDLHQLTLTNATLGSSGIAPIEMLFNRGPFNSGGSEAAVNATGWTPAQGFEVEWVPSMRQVIDLSNFDASTWVNLTGNSGHAYNGTYADQIDEWLVGDQFPWAFSDDAVREDAVNVLTLIPQEN